MYLIIESRKRTSFTSSLKFNIYRKIQKQMLRTFQFSYIYALSCQKLTKCLTLLYIAIFSSHFFSSNKYHSNHLETQFTPFSTKHLPAVHPRFSRARKRPIWQPNLLGGGGGGVTLHYVQSQSPVTRNNPSQYCSTTCIKIIRFLLLIKHIQQNVHIYIYIYMDKRVKHIQSKYWLKWTLNQKDVG